VVIPPAIGAVGDSLGDWVTFGLRVLELIAVVLGFLFVLALFLGLLKSIWNVTVGGQTLVVPFQGSSSATTVGEVLAQQLGTVERECGTLTRSIREAQGPPKESDAPNLVDLGGATPRTRPDTTLDEAQIRIALDNPLQGEALPTISFGGVTFSPDMLFSVTRRVRTAVARRRIRGVVHEFGSTVRLSVQVRLPGKHPDPITIVRDLAAPGQLVGVIDDLAFGVAKIHLGLETDAGTWAGYRAFLVAYDHHVRFLGSASVTERERAIAAYQDSLAAEPDYLVAHYNLAVLLYNRYMETDNEQAIEHFQKASASEDDNLRALALAGLAIAYCQRVHRFGYPEQPSASLADEASTKAVSANPRLEETWFARAFAVQGLGRFEEALADYRKVVDLLGESPEEQRFKSFAQTNAGWVSMVKLGDLEQARGLFEESLRRFPNKMAYANMGELERRGHRYPEALEQYQHAVDLDPEYVNAFNEMGMVYLAMAADARPRDKVEADRLLDAARTLHERAVVLTTADGRLQRAELHRRFADACEAAGFRADADRERTEAEALTQETSTPDAGAPSAPAGGGGPARPAPPPDAAGITESGDGGPVTDPTPTPAGPPPSGTA
jgi:tetratricopeptide (TPR) repeat protein